MTDLQSVHNSDSEHFADLKSLIYLENVKFKDFIGIKFKKIIKKKS